MSLNERVRKGKAGLILRDWMILSLSVLTGHLVISSGHSWGDTEAGSRHILWWDEQMFESHSWTGQTAWSVTAAMLSRLTWDPDGKQSRAVDLYRLTGGCWNAVATLPTPLACSRNKRSRIKDLQLLRTFTELKKVLLVDVLSTPPLRFGRSRSDRYARSRQSCVRLLSSPW